MNKQNLRSNTLRAGSCTCARPKGGDLRSKVVGFPSLFGTADDSPWAFLIGEHLQPVINPKNCQGRPQSIQCKSTLLFYFIFPIIYFCFVCARCIEFIVWTTAWWTKKQLANSSRAQFILQNVDKHAKWHVFDYKAYWSESDAVQYLLRIVRTFKHLQYLEDVLYRMHSWQSRDERRLFLENSAAGIFCKCTGKISRSWIACSPIPGTN